MNFKTRNLFYLRISEHSVLPVYIYLDERHLEWMSDTILQHVLSDLRPRILPKLIAESGVFAASASGKKTVVDTYRGDTYQFCYFLRRTESHSVVTKTRNFVAKSQGQARRRATTMSGNIHGGQKKRKQRASVPGSTPPSRLAKKQRRAKTIESGSESLDEDPSGDLGGAEEATIIVDSGDDDENGIDEVTMSPKDDSFNLPVDGEEEKPKPELQLGYKGFNISGKCLCIVVEPWPVVRSTNRTAPELGGISNQGSTHKPSTQAVPSRAKTPLFLSEDNDMDQDQVETQQLDLETNTWDELEKMDDSDTDSEMGAMMAFSQALNLAGDNRPGAADDEDENEGAVLFGDADEARQL